MPTGIPSLGCSEEGNSVQCQQLNCDAAQLWSSPTVGLKLGYRTAWLWNSTAERLLWGKAPLQSMYTASLYSMRHLQCVSVSGKRVEDRESVFSPWWEGKLCSQSQSRTEVYRSPCPWTLIGPSSYKWGLQILPDLSKTHCPDWLEWGTVIG